MSQPSPSRRLSARKTASTRAAGRASSSRRASKKLRPSRAKEAAADALLIAQFAEALGQAPAARKRRKGGSLLQALETVNSGPDFLSAMPGVRVQDMQQTYDARGDVVPAPCVAVHRRHRLWAGLAKVGSYCFAVLVSAGIIGVTAFALESQTRNTPHATVAYSDAVKPSRL